MVLHTSMGMINKKEEQGSAPPQFFRSTLFQHLINRFLKILDRLGAGDLDGLAGLVVQDKVPRSAAHTGRGSGIHFGLDIILIFLGIEAGAEGGDVDAGIFDMFVIVPVALIYKDGIDKCPEGIIATKLIDALGGDGCRHGILMKR